MIPGIATGTAELPAKLTVHVAKPGTEIVLPSITAHFNFWSAFTAKSESELVLSVVARTKAKSASSHQNAVVSAAALLNRIPESFQRQKQN